MQSLIIFLMLVVGLCFILKLTWHSTFSVLIHAVALGVFTGFIYPLAIVQSSSQITIWLSNRSLMQDVAVLVSIEVVLQMAFSLLTVTINSGDYVTKRTMWIYKILKWFPGILIFMVVFILEVLIIFALPGVSFSAISSILGLSIAAFVPIAVLCLKKIITDNSTRSELLFLANIMIALIGIFATVNVRPSVSVVQSVDISSFVGVVVLIITMFLLGYTIQKIRKNKKFKI